MMGLANIKSKNKDKIKKPTRSDIEDYLNLFFPVQGDADIVFRK